MKLYCEQKPLPHLRCLHKKDRLVVEMYALGQDSMGSNPGSVEQ